MSWWSKMTGADGIRNRERDIGTTSGTIDQAMADEQSGAGWEDAFNKTAGAQLAGALPGLRSSLQMTREQDIRRGISTGDAGTSAEGDLVSAWGRNIGNSFAGQALNAFQNSRSNYLDLLTGKMDRQQADLNAARKRRASTFGAIGAGVGALAGGLSGGGMKGAAAGAQAGGSIGSGLAGY